ncbi:MAG: glutathione S-transferase family protein [Xanthomonadales bacterium]|nr:glutathione S-transferase family protein [Xanthomonadales bacterium]
MGIVITAFERSPDGGKGLARDTRVRWALEETGQPYDVERHPGLFPSDANARARAITWMFAALSTIEPPILDLVTVRIHEGDKPWAAERLPLVADRIRNRLKQLAAYLGDAEWLDGDFSAGDLMMVSVLLRLRPSGILDEFPKLAAYVARGEARPAYQRAFAAQLAVNAAPPSAG